MLFLLDSKQASEQHKHSYSEPFTLAKCQSGMSGHGKQDKVYEERGEKMYTYRKFLWWFFFFFSFGVCLPRSLLKSKNNIEVVSYLPYSHSEHHCMSPAEENLLASMFAPSVGLLQVTDTVEPSWGHASGVCGDRPARVFGRLQKTASGVGNRKLEAIHSTSLEEA